MEGPWEPLNSRNGGSRRWPQTQLGPQPKGNARLLMHFLPLPFFFFFFLPSKPALVTFPVMQEASGLTRPPAYCTRPFCRALGCKVWGQGPLCTAAFHILMQQQPLWAGNTWPDSQLVSSSSRGGRQPSPAVHCDLGPRNLRKHTLLKFPCSAFQQHSLKSCKFFCRINKIPQEATQRTGFPKTLSSLLFLPRGPLWVLSDSKF